MHGFCTKAHIETENIGHIDSTYEHLTLWQFRLNVAQTLVYLRNTRKRGRSSNNILEEGIEEKHHKVSTINAPPKNLHMDDVEHFINYDFSHQRFKMPKGNGYTHKCIKCDVHLCLTKKKTVFASYHLKKQLSMI